MVGRYYHVGHGGDSCALYGAICISHESVFKQNAVIRYVLVMPSLWVGLEALRGVLFTGFPWISLGFSQIDTALSGWAPIFGVLGVSWFVVLSVGAVLLFLTATVKKHKVLAVSILSISWLSGFMLDKVEWTRPMGSPIKVALVQGNIPQEIKWQRSFYQKIWIFIFK